MNDIDARMTDALDAITANMQDEQRLADDIVARTRSAEPKASQRSRRPVAIVAIGFALVAATTTAALGAGGQLRQWFGNDPAAPANKVQALQGAGDSLDMSAFDGEHANYDDPKAALAMWLSIADQTQEAGKDGTSINEAARTLLTAHTDSALGVIQIAAVPTTSGNVCIAFHTADPSGTTCIERLDADAPASATLVGAGDATTVLGLRLDNVDAVSIRTEDGSLQPATLGPNSYVWTGTVDNNAVSLQAHTSEGQTVDVDIAGARSMNASTK